jgi:hypothetical protein
MPLDDIFDSVIVSNFEFNYISRRNLYSALMHNFYNHSFVSAYFSQVYKSDSYLIQSTQRSLKLNTKEGKKGRYHDCSINLWLMNMNDYLTQAVRL